LLVPLKLALIGINLFFLSVFLSFPCIDTPLFGIFCILFQAFTPLLIFLATIVGT
jgi:hypothetical protein